MEFRRPLCIVLLAVVAGFPLLADAAAQGHDAPARDSVEEGTPSQSRRIALSFDDAPRADGPLLSGTRRTRLLIDALAEARVPQAAFFVTTQNIETPADRQRLLDYAAAGHVLANHSHAHQWLSRSTPHDYLADIDRAAAILSEFDGVRPWFRFPFLDEGRDAKRRDQLRQGLAERGLANGYVTVDNYDWYLDASVQRTIDGGAHLDRDALRDVYVEMLLDAVGFYDNIARATLGRSPAHVLLLHENDLAALYIGDLVDALRQRGWTIIGIDEAYADPIARRHPDTLFNSQGRVAALAHAAGRSARELVHPSEDEAWLDAHLAKRGAFRQTPLENRRLLQHTPPD